MSNTVLSASELKVRSLGSCNILSPLADGQGEEESTFLDDDEKILYEHRLHHLEEESLPLSEQPAFEMAGPRKNIYFDPSKTRVGIVTCGGLCPGLNDVIRSLTMAMYYRYGVRRVYGFQYGYEGFVAKYGHELIELTPEKVSDIHEIGGTILGSSRGPQAPSDIVDCLERMNINILFTIGGDGTLRGALDIIKEIDTRGLKIAVVGIPKTIDNDINFVDESFGFQTAVAEAVQSINCAHSEATGAYNGVGLVKLMGRSSGFIACHASLAMPEANFVLIPEVPFSLDGSNGLLAHLSKRLNKRHHAVIVVAEGAGQDLISQLPDAPRDASGNLIFQDIGLFLRDILKDGLKKASIPASIKYIDPSYNIRSVPANPQDRFYCLRLAQNAVHAAMAGKTSMTVANWHNTLVNIPIQLVVRERKYVDPNGDLWRSVLETTGMPMLMT